MPARRSSSATPATSGASGPITARSIAERLRERDQALRVVGPNGVALTERGDPRVARRGVQLEPPALRLSFQASACSRPPDPTISTRTARV